MNIVIIISYYCMHFVYSCVIFCVLIGTGQELRHDGANTNEGQRVGSER